MAKSTRTGQYQIEFMIEGFTAPNRSHAHRFYVQPQSAPTAGAPMSTIALQARGGGTVNADVAANAYWEFLRPMFNNSISCAAANLWYFVSDTVRTFISSVPLTNPLASGTAPQAMQQVTLTFRSALGKPIKIILLETNQSGNASVPLIANPAGNVFQRLANHIMSTNGVVQGIDNAFPIAPLRDARGQNEYLFRQLNR